MIRAARPGDVESLVELENRAFGSDRLSRRSFRHFLSRGNAAVLVAETDSGVAGYALVLFRRNTSLARLYSVAVDPSARGRHLGRKLVRAAERCALDRGASRMRLEVRADNRAARDLYRKLKYRDFEVLAGYYEDGEEALRLEKALAPRLARGLDRVPWFRQSLDFTCGPACLMMAMKAQAPDLTLDRSLELDLWRETTTIFMTSGHGGCSALGLALAAWERGFGVDVTVSDPLELFADSVRSREKKDVIRRVERGFVRKLHDAGIRIRRRPPDAAELREALQRNGMPLLLINSYLLHGDRAPHWVLLTAADARFFYLNDPFVGEGSGRTGTDCIGIPVTQADLERMTRLGRRKHHACVVVRPPRTGGEGGEA